MNPSMSDFMPLQPGAIFQLVQDLPQISSHVELRHIEWGVLLAVTGQHTVAQISDHFGLTPETRQEVFGRLRHFGLIEERPVRFNEYVRARAISGDDSPSTLAQFLTPGATLGAVPGDEPPSPVVTKTSPASDPLANPEAQAAAPNPSSPPTAPLPLTGTSAASSPAALESKTDNSSTIPLVTQVISTRSPIPPVASFEPLEPPPMSSSTGDIATTTQGRHMSLKALMRFIIERAADLNAGQLDVYRVFIRIDSQLLKRNGITTLRFEEDHLVSDPLLKKALANSLQHTLGLPCPQEVFVAA